MALFKKKGKWYIDYYFEGRRIREAIGPNKRTAEKALAVRRAEIAQGRFQLVDAKPSPRLTDFADLYLDHAKTNKKSWWRDEISLRHLREFFGNRRLSQISPFLVEAYKRQRREKVSPKTVNLELACLRHIFNTAIRWGKAAANPVGQVSFFKLEKKPLRVLSEQESETLIQAAPAHLKPILSCALNTGMRKSEIFDLRWDDVDFVNQVITVRRSKSRRYRQIPMNDALLATLRSLRRDGELVFSKGGGEPRKDIRTAFSVALKQSGIRRCRFHDLRHTFASRLVMAGVDLVTVKELLGHASIETTMIYSHPTPEHRRKAVKTLDGHYMDTKEEKPRQAVSLSA